MPLSNPWVGYVTRTYQQIKDAVLTQMAAAVPEITDHTESNLWVKMISIWAGLIEMLGYYLDNQAREAHLTTARLYANMIKHARQHDYRVRMRIPATAVVTVRFTSSVAPVDDNTIPAGTEFTTDEGLKFYSIEPVEVTYGGGIGVVQDYEVQVIQEVQEAEIALGTSDGTPYQEFEVNAPNMSDKSAVVRVNTLAWTHQETLGFSLGYMTHFVQSVGANKLPVILFGDDYQGKIPAAAAALTIQYKTTEGAAGNVGANTITNVTLPFSPVGQTVTCFNAEAASGGTDVESLEQLRRRIPKAIRTLNRAVTYQDYVDIASEAPGVAKAGVRYDCGKYVEIYVVPEGGGIATPTLLSDVELYFDDKKMVTTSVSALAAGEVHIRFIISIVVLPQYSKTTVVDDLKARLVDFMSSANQEIGGTVHLSDIYQIIEATDGVSWSQITTMTSRPYARPINGTTTVLNWSRNTQTGSTTTVQWRIQMINTDDFQLFKDGSYIGTYTTGTSVSLPEIIFGLVGSYTLGEQWEFYTYAYFGDIDLQEPSIPVSVLSDITVNATGGN